MLNLPNSFGIGDVSKAEVAEAASGNQNLLQRLVKGLAGYFRANHSSNRRRRFVNGYSLHAYSERFLR